MQISTMDDQKETMAHVRLQLLVHLYSAQLHAENNQHIEPNTRVLLGYQKPKTRFIERRRSTNQLRRLDQIISRIRSTIDSFLNRMVSFGFESPRRSSQFRNV